MLHHIKAGGEERPFNAGFRAQVAFETWREEYMKAHPNTDAVELGVEATIMLAYYGFSAGARREHIKPNFTPDDIEAWFDEDMSLVMKVKEIWDSAAAKAPESEGKKKPQTRGSSQSSKK